MNIAEQAARAKKPRVVKLVKLKGPDRNNSQTPP
jgi:hypothetical protein